MVMFAPLAAPLAKAGISAVVKKVTAKKAAVKKGAKVLGYRRRRTRLLSLSQREELTWISRHLGRTAAAERMAHYRR